MNCYKISKSKEKSTKSKAAKNKNDNFVRTDDEFELFLNSVVEQPKEQRKMSMGNRVATTKHPATLEISPSNMETITAWNYLLETVMAECTWVDWIWKVTRHRFHIVLKFIGKAVHAYLLSRRFQIRPLWRAFSDISVFYGQIRQTLVDRARNRECLILPASCRRA